MNLRQPVVAGQFYEGSHSTCRHHAERLLASAAAGEDLPAPLVGGLVPHAGWTYSGPVAARTLRALLDGATRETVVLFGAVHRGLVEMGEVYDSGVWRTPLGDVAIDERLAAELIAAADCCRANPDAHAQEHSLEVQLPLLQVLAPEAKILPIAVPPTEIAVEIGRAVGSALTGAGPEICVVGSTDLTHHGRAYRSTHHLGTESEPYARANDRRMLDAIEAMDADGIVPEARRNHNACGAGAIAATIAACRALGAEKGICLEYTNSYAITHAKYAYDPDDSTVGYASVVFA